MPCKTFIPRGILTFVFLNLEIENFNEKADRCLRTASQLGSIHYRRGTLCLGPGKRGGLRPHCLTHPFILGLAHTTEFLEGKQVGGRRKEKGNRRGKKRGRGYGVFM